MYTDDYVDAVKHYLIKKGYLHNEREFYKLINDPRKRYSYSRYGVDKLLYDLTGRYSI